MNDPVNLHSVKEPAEKQESQSRELIALMAEPNPLVARDLDESRIIHPRTRDQAAFNTFRELRTELLNFNSGNNFSCAVTSVVAGGGSTHVALNLASAIALDRTKTALIVDCNIYRPALHERLKLESSPGLTDFLADPDGVSIEDIIRPTGIPRVRAIPAGGRIANNSEYFGTVNMRLLIHMLQQRYPDRFVILDAPDMTAAADTRILAGYTDLVCVVVPYGRVTSSRIVDASRTFDKEKFAGIVFNRLPPLWVG